MCPIMLASLSALLPWCFGCSDRIGLWCMVITNCYNKFWVEVIVDYIDRVEIIKWCYKVVEESVIKIQ